MAVNGFKKKASKRQTTRHRVKVEKKIREHHRKQRKLARKIPKQAKLRRKDPGVPNSLPFKDDILQEAQRQREKREQEKLEAKQRRKEARAKSHNEKRMITARGGQTVKDLVMEAAAKQRLYEQKAGFVEGEKARFGSGKAVEGSLKAYYKEFRKVVEAADVILEVLDARDPIGSRCPQVEQAVISAGTNKKLVLILNKIDLVPKENVEAWLKYLRNELPTIAFKSSTQSQSDNLSRSYVSIVKASEGLVKSSLCLGADVLMKLLANYSRNKDLKTAIRVGVVGFPNTGKSSLINSLKRSKACQVGNTPGITKSMQEVQLDKNVRLLDSPGIVMATADEQSSAHNILRNAVKVETIADPIAPVEVILSRCRKEQMMIQYKLPTFTDTAHFLNLMAKRYGLLKKGGVPNTDKAARMVLQDWNSGKITYYTEPPEQHTLPTHLSATVVTEMSKEFDIDALTNDDASIMQSLRPHIANAMKVESQGFTSGRSEEDDGTAEDEDGWMDDDDDDDGEEDDVDEEEMVTDDKPQIIKQNGKQKARAANVLETAVVMPDPTPRRKTRLSVSKKLSSPVAAIEDLQQNKQKQKEFKKMKKQRRRADKLSDDLTSAMESGLGGLTADDGNDYDFDDF